MKSYHTKTSPRVKKKGGEERGTGGGGDSTPWNQGSQGQRESQIRVKRKRSNTKKQKQKEKRCKKKKGTRGDTGNSDVKKAKASRSRGGKQN